MTIIYEVNILVQEACSDKYLAWLKPHALEMYKQIENLKSHTITVTKSVDRSAIPQSAELAVFGSIGKPPGAQADGTINTATAEAGNYLMDTSKWHLFVITYVIASREDLQDYLDERAAAMRAGVQKAFTAEELASFVSWRRILDVVE